MKIDLENRISKNALSSDPAIQREYIARIERDKMFRTHECECSTPDPAHRHRIGKVECSLCRKCRGTIFTPVAPGGTKQSLHGLNCARYGAVVAGIISDPHAD